MNKKELEAENKILKDALNGTYDAICDVCFFVVHDIFDDMGKALLHEAVEVIEEIAKENEWFKKKKIEIDNEGDSEESK